MTPTSPVIPGQERDEIKIAEHQAEYGTLPAITLNRGRVVLSRWHLSLKERLIALVRGDVYLFVWTFGNPLQPVLLQVEKPSIDEPRISTPQEVAHA